MFVDFARLRIKCYCYVIRAQPQAALSSGLAGGGAHVVQVVGTLF